MTSESKEFKNIDGIIITDDEFIHSVYKNVSIKSQEMLTPRMLEIEQSIKNLALDTFYKISIEISNYYSQDEQKVDGCQEDLDSIISVFKYLTRILIKNNLLTEEEMEADLKDIKHCYSNDFITNSLIYITNFVAKLTDLNQNYYHA